MLHVRWYPIASSLWVLLYRLRGSTFAPDPIRQEKHQSQLRGSYAKYTSEHIPLWPRSTSHLTPSRQAKENMVLWTILISPP